MMEIKIWTKHMSPGQIQDLLEYLHQKVLKHDRDWHFFWEDSYTLIRCRKTTLFFLRKRLDRLEIHNYDEAEWVDGNSTVEKYKKSFTGVFHANSELILDPERQASQDIIQVVERAIHSLLLNHYPLFYGTTKSISPFLQKRPLFFEVAILNLLIQDRRKYIEFYYDYHSKQKRATERTD